jgi:hypothetical protein
VATSFRQSGTPRSRVDQPPVVPKLRKSIQQWDAVSYTRQKVALAVGVALLRRVLPAVPLPGGLLPTASRSQRNRTADGYAAREIDN